MNIEWLQLRPLDGDIKNGFEELVCQLARVEEIKGKKQFIRVAAPDAGVEAYCVLLNGDEYGWQAKYFTLMDKSQWTQITNSFKTALDKHPNLKKYYICTPLDRQDPRVDNQKWFMDKWNEHVTEWITYANKLGRTIEFEYWGSSELFERLSKPKNEGKLKYWFGKEEFSDQWFKDKLGESIVSLGQRYTPEINFDLPITKIFDGLSRDTFLQKQFEECLNDLLKNFNKGIKYGRSEKVNDLIEAISVYVEDFKFQYDQIDFYEVTPIDISSFSTILDLCADEVKNLINRFYELEEEEKKIKEKPKYSGNSSVYGYVIELFRNFQSAIRRFENFLGSSTVNLANNPVLILTGPAGIGKSHLLADIAKRRETRNQFTLLLLGQQFATTEDTWTQISKLLQVSLQRDALLGALNAKAESTNSRILIFIDAINEGEGRTVWKNHLSSFITVVKRFPNIGVVFSVRSSYERLLVPKEIIDKNQAIKVTHYGFARHEYEASKLFFQNYGIKQPSIPLLHPEFSNPLFLKLFCDGLHKKGLIEIPNGYEGISSIINFFLQSINEKISEKHGLPFQLQTVQKVVRQIAAKIADTSNSYLKYDEAFALVIDLKETKSVINKPRFFHDLISEGLLTQNLFWDMSGNHNEGIYLAYERFGDHLIAAQLLDGFLNKKDPEQSFAAESSFAKIAKNILSKMGMTFKPRKLYELVKTEDAARYNKGILEALSIQLPEQTGMELYDVAPHAKEFDTVAVAFVESIIWRKKQTLEEKQLSYINEVIIGKLGYKGYFLKTILLITSTPQNYFNSDFLHNYLVRFTMADRDADWTQFIHEEYSESINGEISIVQRMVDWAWTEDNRVNISKESIRLICQTMIWFLTSNNRKLRDSATKGVICLLEERLDVLMELIEIFENVNDPYVSQRLYAIAYGCTLRTSNSAMLKPLGELVFKKIFDNETVSPDMLLRDYARGVIEFAVYKGHAFDFDMAKIRPPYKSEFVEVFPTNEETEKFNFDYSSKDFKESKWSQNSILRSMVTEYGRGISGYGDFGRYVFQRALADWRINVNDLSNLAVKWIFQKYGYDIEKHGEFDRGMGYGGRHEHTNERIGKKYQWIAFYELLARISDNYPLYEDYYNADALEIKYDGPWEPNVRDIDPTMIIRRCFTDNSVSNWWNPVSYSNWEHQNKEWIEISNDIPNPMESIEVKDKEGNEWLVLEMYSNWVQPAKLGEEDYGRPRKNLSNNISSFILSKKESEKAIQYLINKNFYACDLPEVARHYQMFSREYFWAPANKTFKTDYYRGNEWDDMDDIVSGEEVCKIARTALEFAWEDEYDLSKDETINFYKPSEIVFNLLNLEYSKTEGKLLNKNGEVICFDPCAFTASPTCLVVRKSELLKALVENDMDIIWTCVQEKTVIGGNLLGEEYVGRLHSSNLVYFEKGKLKSMSYFAKDQ